MGWCCFGLVWWAVVAFFLPHSSYCRIVNALLCACGCLQAASIWWDCRIEDHPAHSSTIQYSLSRSYTSWCTLLIYFKVFSSKLVQCDLMIEMVGCCFFFGGGYNGGTLLPKASCTLNAAVQPCSDFLHPKPLKEQQ